LLLYAAITSSLQISGIKVAALVLSTAPPILGYTDVAMIILPIRD